MTRCAEFWDKWEREPNFCGLSPQSISEIKGYLELRDKVIKMGMAKAVFYDKCPSGACRPVLRLADDGTRNEATNYIISCLKRGEKVTQGDLKGFVDMRLKKEAVCKVTPKIDRASTQMRTQEQSDAAPVTNTAPYPSLAEQMKSEPYGTQHVHPGPAAINPVIINDTHRESPFKTAAQVKAGIAGEMFPDKRPEPAGVSTADQERIKREEMELVAEDLLDRMPQGTKTMAAEIMRAHPSFKIKDVFYHGVAALHEKESKGGRR